MTIFISTNIFRAKAYRSFLPDAILPAFMRTAHHAPQPLNVAMLIASAAAGRWGAQATTFFLRR